MSGIARVLHERGISVTGSDLKTSRYERGLSERGVPVAIGHDAANLGDPEVVVISSAIPESNPELAAARERGIEVWPRARMLAELADGRTTIAIAGTHGKTSTSSMIATMLDRMGEDPTFLIGGEVDGYGSNAQNGAGSHFVIEADESDGSFIHLTPDVSVITNIEMDHLDHYSGIDEIHDVFVEFLSRAPECGIAVVCGDSATPLEVVGRTSVRPVTYGFAPGNEARCEVVSREGEVSRARVTFTDGVEVEVVVKVPGDHMVVNATGALATAWALGLDREKAAAALSTFSGVRRRFDRVGEAAGIIVVDDYGHHPTEVAKTVAAASTLGHKRVHVLFQPHRYTRTQAFVQQFAESFDEADSVTFMEIYSAGETPIPGITGKTLVDAVLHHRPHARVGWMPNRGEIPGFMKSRLRSGDLLITMGAGDVTAIGPLVLEALESES